MRPSTPRLSIGAKLALRYTAALAITVSVVAAFVYAQIEHRMNRDALLLLEVQTEDLAETYESQRAQHPPDEVLAWMRGHAERVVERADPSLRLGVALLSASGEPVLATGSLAEASAPLSRAMLLGEVESQVRAVNLGGDYAFLSMAIRVPDGFLQVALDTRRYAENVAHIRDVFLLSLPLVLLLTALGGWMLARGSLHPIAHITQTAQRITGANLDESVPVTGSGDELDQLATTLNDMLGRIREGLERMRRFNADAAHELRTPLTAISSQIEVTLEKERDSDEYRAVLAGVLERVHALAGGVDAMLRLARTEAGIDAEHRVPTALRSVIETVVEFFAPLAEEGGIDLRTGALPDAVVLGDASWLHQLFSNLVANAIKFTPAGGRVCVESETDGESVRVHVRDTGPGIPAEALSLVFERFHRLRHDRAGFGLGLPIAQEIARAHGGRIEVASAEGAGTLFSVCLPLAHGEREES